MHSSIQDHPNHQSSNSQLFSQLPQKPSASHISTLSPVSNQKSLQSLQQKPLGVPINLYANSFMIHSDKKRGVASAFKIIVSPPIPNDDTELQTTILTQATRTYQRQYAQTHAVRVGQMLYMAGNRSSEDELPEIQIKCDGSSFKVKTEFVQVLLLSENSKLFLQLLNSHLQAMLAALKFQRIGRFTLYDTQNQLEFPIMGFNLWPGYQPQVTLKANDIFFLQIKPSYEVIRTDTSLLTEMTLIKEVNENQNLDWKTELREYLTEAHVVTLYNKRSYRVTDVCFEMTPMNSFEFQGTRITFAEYLEKRYQMRVTVMQQPLLLVNSQKPCFLVPEFCFPIGMTEKLKSQKAAYREVAMHQNSDAPIKIKEEQQLVQALMSNKQCLQRMQEWRFYIHGQVFSQEGQKLSAGTISMGHHTLQTAFRSVDSDVSKLPIQPHQSLLTDPKLLTVQSQERIKLDIEASGKDLRIALLRNKLFDAPVLNKWGIFYASKDYKSAKEFVQTTEKFLNGIDYQAKPMAMFPVQGANLELWRQEILARVRTDVQVIILLLPGGKNGSDLYPELKRFLLEQVPVVSQVVLTGTIRYGKNLRSIVSKICVQICAKIGGVPWVVDQLPLADKKLMICGIDVYHHAGEGSSGQALSMMGFCATYNKTCTKYHSQYRAIETAGSELCLQLQECMDEAIQHFFKINNALPERIIVYRNGVSENKVQQLAQIECQLLKQALKNYEQSQQIEFAYLSSAKGTQVELYAEGFYVDSFKNGIPGTVLDRGITLQNDESILNEFYLLISTSKFGISQPARFMLLHNTIEEVAYDRFQLLTYKLCHSYFNVPTATRQPAPILYARKLAKMMAQRSYVTDMTDVDNTVSVIKPLKVHPLLSTKAPGLYFL